MAYACFVRVFNTNLNYVGTTEIVNVGYVVFCWKFYSVYIHTYMYVYACIQASTSNIA